MNNGNMGTASRSFGFLFRIRERFRTLFKKKLTEPLRESGEEAKWEADYRDIARTNFTEIFANRLTNYTLCEGIVECDDPALDAPLQKAVDKWYKWVQMAFGTGRVFLIPYCIGDSLYTDVIPQGRAWTTKNVGDDVVGIGVIADLRYKDKETFARIASYEWDPVAKTFTIENKAIRGNGAEVPLSILEEWETIEPIITLHGIERPLFTFVDCPKDNRSTDRMQGAPITFGCDGTIKEILDCFDQYADEYDLKQSWLGVDRAMLDKNGQPDKSKLYKTFIGKNTESLFEIFSPDIRDASYKARILDLFARLEKQVGTSAGILTPAETSNATATQVRRSMFDTLAIVDRMRYSIERALNDLGYIYGVYMDLLGIHHEKEYSIKAVWGQSMVTDSAERFSQLIQAESAGAVKTSEVRQFVYPNETPEEAEAAIQEIKEAKPEPQIPDFFGS